MEPLWRQLKSDLDHAAAISAVTNSLQALPISNCDLRLDNETVGLRWLWG